MYLYSYLVADLAMLLIWVVLFLWRKDVRKTMWWLSVIFGFVGLVVEYIFIADWWRPLTITHTPVGIEDFLFGFWIAGISAVIYEEVFKKKVYLRKPRPEPQLIRSTALWAGGVAALFYGTFYLLHVSSYYASLFCLVPAILFIWIKRHDLIPDSVVSGLLMSGVGFLWFASAELFSPGWVRHYWMLSNLSGLFIWRAPLEDITWIFLAGAFIGPLYEIWQGAKLVPYAAKKRKKKSRT